MQSIRQIYKIGKGPSSSHTMGPERAAGVFRSSTPEADRYRVILYGSLSKTGVGHGTDRVLVQELSPVPTEVVFGGDSPEGCHPNTMDFFAEKDGTQIGFLRAESIGGGDIRFPGSTIADDPDVYPENSFSEVSHFCKQNYIPTLSRFVELREGPEIWDYLAQVWKVMKQAIQDGLSVTGTLPGGLNVQRRAQFLLSQHSPTEAEPVRECRHISAYAFAVAEQNADNGTIVTAPTCGACGVVPAVLKYFQDTQNASDEQILRGLAAAGLVGSITKKNASISGAECGCQAEIGTACSMAAAALAEMYGLELDQVEYAAEIAMEHHLGLTCDPICGLVQIPCIERNAVAALRAMNACNLSYFLYTTRNISYDMVVKAMRDTGINLREQYRETSEGGLARIYETK